MPCGVEEMRIATWDRAPRKIVMCPPAGAIYTTPGSTESLSAASRTVTLHRLFKRCANGAVNPGACAAQSERQPAGQPAAAAGFPEELGDHPSMCQLQQCRGKHERPPSRYSSLVQQPRARGFSSLHGLCSLQPL